MEITSDNACMKYSAAYFTGRVRVEDVWRGAGLFTMRSFVGVISAVVAFACGAAETADFANGTGVEGWTIESGVWISPAYTAAVDSIRLEYAGEGGATLYAGVDGTPETQIATFTSNSCAATLEFPDATDFRKFKIARSGGLDLLRFAAEVSATSLETPADVAISNNVTGTSFDAHWSAVSGATGYKVYVWTNAVADATEGTVVWQETFSNAPSTTSNQMAFKKDHTDSGVDVWGSEKAYICSTEGAVRIGTTSAKGCLVSPSISGVSGDSLALRITAWRMSTSEGRDMPLGVVSSGVTNVFAHVTIGDEATTYHVAMPPFNDGDSIAIFSPTNNKSARAIIDDVAIVSGYSEGRLEPSYIVDGLDVGAATSYSFSELPSVPVQFAVAAYGRRGVASEMSEAAEVDLANPDKIAVLNACPLSSLADSSFAYSQNFDSLATLTATTGDKEWLNGTTLQYWQAYKGNNAVAAIKYNGGSTTSGGLYALATNQSHSVRALGARSTQSDEFSWGIAFTNDTDGIVSLASLEYAAQQWGFGNSTNQPLSVSALVTNSLDWISAHGDGWTELSRTESTKYAEGEAHETPVSTFVAINPAESSEQISIAPGQVLLLKWTAHSLKSGTPGMIGIDDVTVTFSTSRGFTIRLVRK